MKTAYFEMDGKLSPRTRGYLTELTAIRLHRLQRIERVASRPVRPQDDPLATIRAICHESDADTLALMPATRRYRFRYILSTDPD